MINIIVAVSENNVIGDEGLLPWNLKKDLKHFKTLTNGNIVVMGRKTYESIGKALPNRKNYVLSKDCRFKPTDADVQTSMKTVISYCKQSDKETFIIGGGHIYNMAFLRDFVDRVYLTRVHTNVKGDVYFNFDESKWIEVSREFYKADENNDHDFSIIMYDRKN